MQFRAQSLNELAQVAAKILDELPKGVVLLQGPMGAGKTTLITALCKALGVQDSIHSPTFSLVNEYEGSSGQKIYHFDFYRIENEEEALDMGYEDYLWSGNWCFIEWPEKIPTLLPEQSSLIRISVEDGVRMIEVKKP